MAHRSVILALARRRVALALVACATFAVSAWAVPKIVGPLPVPVASPPPQQKIPRRMPRLGKACVSPRRVAALPFAPGEQLTFEADIYGLEIAELHTVVEAPTEVGGRRLMPIFATLESDWTLRWAARFDGDMRTWVDPQGISPSHFAWRLSARTPKVDFYGQSGVEFGADGLVNAQTHWVYKEFGKDEVEERGHEAYRTRAGVQDLLSVVYQARTFELEVGTTVCPVLHMITNVGVLQARVTGRERVDVDYGTRWAHKLVISQTGAKQGAGDLHIAAWISDDPQRLPLRLQIKRDRITVELELDDVERG